MVLVAQVSQHSAKLCARHSETQSSQISRKTCAQDSKLQYSQVSRVVTQHWVKPSSHHRQHCMNEPKNVSQSRLEAILNNAVDAIITIDEAGIIESANPATEKLFGFSFSEIDGQNVKLLMPPPYQDEHDGYLRNYVQGGAPRIIGTGREVIGRRKDGTVFPMHLAVSEFFDGDRRLFTGIVRDISDLKEAENRLKQLNEDLEKLVDDRTEKLRAAQEELVKKEKLATLGQVSGGIAHEIRNPLNAVKTSIYYLVNARKPTEEKKREHLDRIDRQVTLIDNVVTALSDVAKLPDPTRKPISIDRILRDVVQGVRLPESITVTWEISEGLPKVLADEYQIPIAFKNLVRNARDSMEEGGEITLSAMVDGQRVQISVKDTGIGIAANQLGKIMEPLYSTKARGMGLGLAITRAVVEKNGGELRVQSKEGVGSSFTVLLDADS